MRGLFNVVRWGWRSLRTPSGPPLPFEVACCCGQVQGGVRSARAQFLRCPGCGEAVFILPRSPWPALPDELPAPGAEGTRRSRSPWLLPLAAATLTLAVVVSVYGVLFFSWRRQLDSTEESGGNASAAALRESIASGRELLRKGNFRLAADQLAEARTRSGDNPALHQLYRQARLLAQLLPLSLEEVVQRAQNERPEEWPEQFKDFKGRAVLFDDVVRRDDKEAFHLAFYKVNAGDEKAVVKIDLKVLRRLPLGQPRRLLFGARLESVRRGAGGVWEIAFDPDSGVLLTDEGAAAACALGPLDAELREVVRQQARWLR